MIEISSDYITFVSDAHFRECNSPSEKSRREAFKEFLESLPDNSVLVLLGDIFDFYFEYASVIHKGYFDIFTSLHKLTTRGIEVHFIGGNHDSWTGPFMKNELGIHVHKEKMLFKAQGRSILCVHGDLDLPGDRGYKMLKVLIRNHAVVKLAKFIHPDFLSIIAVIVSKGSKRLTGKRQEPVAASLCRTAFSRFFSNGNDAFIMGHVHFPVHKTEGGKDFLILGDWIDHFSYAVLENEKIKPKRFKV